MMYLKACPRCHGDMNVSQDRYGAYRQCVQCGYILELDHKGLLQASIASDENEAA
ncbi:MAG: hypothetical protein HY666_05495 [Chloroflexi bacterium]|nr:hypothetical protein [Chloroflexota bacterium]